MEQNALPLEIIFLHSLNYFVSSNTVIGAVKIQTSVLSCLEKMHQSQKVEKHSGADLGFFSSAPSTLRL